jgi:LPS export ABC transporter protein LptC
MSVISRKSINLLFAAILLVFCALSFYLFSIRKEGMPKGTNGVRQIIEKKAEAAFQKFHFTEREKGEKKWEVWADRAERLMGESKVHLDHVKMEFLLEKGGAIHLSGRTGEYFEKEQRVVLKGDAEAEDDTGYRLYADELVWDGTRGLLYSKEPVRLVTGLYVVNGNRMTYRPSSKELEVDGNIRVVITPVRREGRDAK